MVILSNEDLEKISEELERKDAFTVIEWALKNFHPKIALACSFQAEDIVILDMMSKIVKDPIVFTIDTGRLHQETYEIMDIIREKYGIKILVYFPNTEAVENMVREYGVNLFYKSVELRKLCCNIRKVEPLKRALKGLDAWITGLRREQNETRKTIRKVEKDYVNGGIIKINPLADWTWKQVWDYIKSNNLPYNKLYDKNYKSIGCAPCTRPVFPWEDPRAGRWWWEISNKECGLHFR
jgi:phosphoadenosine phosphosulfate reductase